MSKKKKKRNKESLTYVLKITHRFENIKECNTIVWTIKNHMYLKVYLNNKSQSNI